ncbi:MAG: hypothetical protein HQ561_14520 [Desulfobacteraceae bacterium]|nr:hypothetical protein [Desulfobacteraceae bacterium]
MYEALKRNNWNRSATAAQIGGDAFLLNRFQVISKNM